MNNRLGTLQYGIIALTVITALIHLVLGITFFPDFLGILFILNAIGYLVLLAGLYFVPQLAKRRGTFRWLLLAFTAVTFVLYFVFNWPDLAVGQDEILSHLDDLSREIPTRTNHSFPKIYQ